jgi:hypothetical protein
MAHTIIVERHHGTISSEQNPESGTIFTILLPLDRGEWLAKNAMTSRPAASRIRLPFMRAFPR